MSSEVTRECFLGRGDIAASACRSPCGLAYADNLLEVGFGDCLDPLVLGQIGEPTSHPPAEGRQRDPGRCGDLAHGPVALPPHLERRRVVPSRWALARGRTPAGDPNGPLPGHIEPGGPQEPP